MNDVMSAQYASCFKSTTSSYSHTYKHITNSCQVYLGSLMVPEVSRNPWRLLEWCFYSSTSSTQNHTKFASVQTL